MAFHVRSAPWSVPARCLTFQRMSPHALKTLPLPDRPFLSVRETATVLGVNVKTLYNEINRERFPAIRLGRTIRIARNVVATCMEQGRIAPQGESHADKTR